MAAIPRLKTQYRESVAPELKKEFAYSSQMQTPRLEKVSVSVGVGVGLEVGEGLGTGVAVGGMGPMRVSRTTVMGPV